MEIQNAKNANTGDVNTGGGDFRLGDNFYKSLEYKELIERIEELEELVTNTQDETKKLKFSKRLNEEKEKLDGLKRDVMFLAEIFSKIEINTERLILAKEYFDKGEFKQADAILKAEEMADDLNKLIAEDEKIDKKKEEIKQSREQLANEYLIKARLTATKFDLPDRLQKTIEYFNLSLKAHRIPENIFAFAYLLNENNQFNEAVPLYEEALTLYRKLAQINPEAYLSDVATTLNNLGNLQRARNELEKAEKSYLEALEIRRKLAEINPEAYLSGVAMTLNNLGLLQRARNELEKAEKSYLEALEIRRKLAQMQPSAFEIDLADTCLSLSSLYCTDKVDKNASLSYAQEAYLLYEKYQEFVPHASHWGKVALEIIQYWESQDS